MSDEIEHVENEEVGWWPGFGPSSDATQVFDAASARFEKLLQWGIEKKMPRLAETISATKNYRKAWEKREADLALLGGYKGDVEKLEREAEALGYQKPIDRIAKVDIESSSIVAASGSGVVRELDIAKQKITGPSDDARIVYDKALARYQAVLAWGAKEKLPFLKNTFDEMERFKATWAAGNPDLTKLSNWKNDVLRIEKYAAEKGYSAPKEQLGAIDIENVSTAMQSAVVVDEAAQAAGTAIQQGISKAGGAIGGAIDAISNIPWPYKVGAGVVVLAGVWAFASAAGKRV